LGRHIAAAFRAPTCCAKATAGRCVLRYPKTMSNSRTRPDRLSPKPVAAKPFASKTIARGKGLLTRHPEIFAPDVPVISKVLPMRRAAAELGALLALVLTAHTALAASDGESPVKAPGTVEKTFLIPSSEGYGVGDCLTNGESACGQVVANAWCEAQGFASAGSFGVAAQDEYTGAIPVAPVVKPAERPIRITCQD
jgi:hypothetical protein